MATFEETYGPLANPDGDDIRASHRALLSPLPPRGGFTNNPTFCMVGAIDNGEVWWSTDIATDPPYVDEDLVPEADQASYGDDSTDGLYGLENPPRGRDTVDYSGTYGA